MGEVSKQPSEGGSGGKRGHSNMEHRVYNDEIKEASRHKRRKEDDSAAAEGLKDAADEHQVSRAT